MEAPAHICRALAAFHPQLRLGWDGNLREFALLQLYTRRDAERSPKERWNQGRYHGPVWSASGRPGPDWNYWERIPVMVAGITPEDVHTGAVVRMVKRWARPILTRIYEGAKARARATENKVAEVCHDFRERAWHEANKPDNGAPIVAKKFHKPQANLERMRRGELDFSDKLQIPKIDGGIEKHAAKDQGDAGDLGSV